jgi:hypothetical protein
MFNLDHAIKEWRRQMLDGGIKTPVPMDELESHLREDIERQMQSGLDEAEAFRISVLKMGQARALESEFKKVEAIKEERAWKFINKLIVIGAGVISLGVTGLVLSKAGSFSQMTSEQQLSGLAAVVVFSLVVWGGRLGYKIFSGILVRRTRDAVVGSCAALLMLWWIIFFNILLPRYNFTAGQLSVMVLWAFMTPTGVVFGLAGGIETARRKVTMTHS